MGLRGLFSRGVKLAHDGWIELVYLLACLAVLVFQAQSKCAQAAFFLKTLLPQRDWQRPGQIALTIRSLIAMAARVPGIDSDLVEVIRLPLMVLREEHEVLRDLFAGVDDFVQGEYGD